MNKYSRWLAVFTLGALPLFSAESEVASPETVQMTNKKSTQTTGKGSAQMPEEQMIQSTPVITPPLAPHIVDGSDTFFNLDFIWWKSVLGGAEYAYTGVIQGTSSSILTAVTSTGEGRVQRPAFTFQPGFKAGLGVNFDHDGWDLFAQYTYLVSQSETNTLTASPPGTLGRNIPGVVTNNVSDPNYAPITSASCKWKQSFSVVDLELGRDYFISRYLTLRPSAGLKTAWITEQSKMSYTPVSTYIDQFFSPGGSNFVQNVLLTYRQNMWGLGIRTALNAGWHFTKNWMIYNDFAFSALWSDFHIHQKQNLVGSVTGSQTTQFTEESLQTVIPVFEAGLGVSYIAWFNCSRYRFEFRAGWEEQIWLDFNHYMSLGGTGNLSVQGLTLKALLNF